MSRFRHHRLDALALLTLMLLPLLWFLPVLFPAISGVSLLPYDNLYTFEPWRSLRPGLLPHNELLSDLVLENAVWKLHINRTLADRQLPLWNPQIFSGLPFLAAGQASTLYPLNILFYILPLEVAYGWFTALQIGLAGVNTYIFGRTLRLHPLAALLSGVIFMFSGFLIVSVVFTMFIAAVVWLPLLLAVIERIAQKQEEKGVQSFRPIPYVAVGAAIVGLVVLAGHPELLYYTLLVAGAYAAVRLFMVWRRASARHKSANRAEGTAHEVPAAPTPINEPWCSVRRVLKLAGWLLLMVALGIAAGAVQLFPLLELLPLNFREGSASLQQVLEWAWPDRHVLTFFLPDVFGNPSHHRWFDPWARQWIPATVNALGEPNQTIFWGIKNYVEGGNYLGVVTWLLAAIAMLAALVHRQQTTARSPQRIAAWFFAGLALVSLLFAFGTPLYALLFYGLPGWSQLHSPFRWVFPFTLSMAMLAGIGLQALLEKMGEKNEELEFEDRRPEPRIFFVSTRAISILSVIAGVGLLSLVAISIFTPEPFIALGQRVVDGSDLAQMAFADGRMFWGYQAAGIARLGLFALLSGLLLWLLLRLGASTQRRTHLLALALIALVALDLYAVHGHFNPATSVELSPLQPENVPPVVQFLNEREGEQSQPWRFTTFNLPGEKTFNANVGMYYGWHDIRGYDSIIPRQYVALMDRIAPQENELLYNRIAPLYLGASAAGDDPYAALDNPLLDMLNVKYVLTQEYIPNPGWREIYRDDAIAVYENEAVLPRAFVADAAQMVPDADQALAAAMEIDPTTTIVLDAEPAHPNALDAASPQIATAAVSRYTANDVFVDVNLSDRGWLMLTDAYFPGWKAYIRPFGAGENEERELPIYRANGAFRAVYLPEDGQWTVRFVYTPMSFKLGLYTSFLAVMSLLLLLLWWAWGKYYRPESTEGAARTVAKNSLVPMGLNLSNKAIDFAFAMLYVRLLGPTGTGQYYFVVAIYGFFEIISRYGLGTLLARDVAADKNQSSRYLTNVMVLRTLLWLASLPVMALVTYGYRIIGELGIGAQSIGVQEVQALALLAIAMLFANWSDALSNMFNAFEKMEYPAGLASAVALFKVTLGALVLLMGWGFVGLAGVSLVVNIAQLIWMSGLLRRTLFKPEWKLDWSLQRWMLGASGPLMINHLLATIFWRIDIWILRPRAGAASVGLYSIGIKYLDGLNIIPSVFTMAVFPVMSRYARQGERNLLRSYTISVRLLLLISLPIALSITFLAEPLAWLVGGGQFINQPESVQLFGRTFFFLGGADLALQVIIWSIPIGFVNSVTQFVLIAVNQQRYLTKAFLLGVAFNVVGNLLFIPTFGYVGAAVITIFSEFSLLFPFYYSVRRHVGVVPWFSLCAAPTAATVIMGLGVFGLENLGVNMWIAVALGWGIYLAALLATGAFRNEDMAVVWQALPVGPLKRLLPSHG